MRWSLKVVGDETGYRCPSFINQETETVFHLPHFLFAIFSIKNKAMQGSTYHAIKSEL